MSPFYVEKYQKCTEIHHFRKKFFTPLNRATVYTLVPSLDDSCLFDLSYLFLVWKLKYVRFAERTDQNFSEESNSRERWNSDV